MPFLEVDGDGELLTPERLRSRGLRAAYEMRLDRTGGRETAEAHGRRAVQDLVDAFMADRRGQRDQFAIAHRVGRELSETFGCELTYDSAEHIHTSSCPIDKLHAVVATSIGWSFEATCSICDAEMFKCGHSPGELYGDDVCFYRTGRLLLFDHIALTTHPDFPYTWITDNRRSAGTLLAQGVIGEPGDRVACRHCETCYGLAGASDDDLDPVGRWKRLQSESSSSSAPSSGLVARAANK